MSTRNFRALQQYIFSSLQNCKTTRQLLQLHAQIILNNVSQKNYILAKLLSFCITSKHLQHAHKAFNQIKSPTTILWNQIIRGYARSETPHLSVHLYNEMYTVEAKPDEFTYSSVLTACAKPGLLREGEQLHGRVFRNGLGFNVFIQTNLVNMYAGSGDESRFVIAREVFDEMTERSVVSWNCMIAGYLRFGFVEDACKVFDEMPERNVVSWTTMIGGCVRNGKCKEGLSLFWEMWREGVGVDRVVMVAALTACAELGDLRTGSWIHSFVDKSLGLEDSGGVVSMKNAIMHMYASCGVIEEAYRLFQAMKEKSVVSWTTVIIGFAKQGRGKEALDVFRSMQNGDDNDKVRPDGITFIGVLCACSHTGMVEMGRHYFEYMSHSCGIKPKIEHAGCMVDLLSRAGLLDEAHNLMETMPMKPNDAIWGALLGGCRIYKNIELASHAAQQLSLELDPDSAAGYLVLLSNVYASAKNWVEVANVRQKMVQTSVKKPPGRSWIQVDGVIHDFVAGDWTHKHASAICEMVEELTREAKLEHHLLELPEVV